VSTFYIESLGCSKNQVDAETIIVLLGDAGWTYVEQPEDAELIVVNTCGFIQSAKEESIASVLDLRRAYPEKRIVVAGCLAQRHGTELREELLEADAVVGNADLSQVVDAVRRRNDHRPLLFADHREVAPRRSQLLSQPGSAFVKIGEGCSNRCSYCAIPLIRGDLRSRSPESVEAEVRDLVARGIEEVNLVAQELVPLLRRILTIDGDFWLRMLYMHPEHVPDGLTAVVQSDPRVLPYFDLPFQHASHRILRLMGRSGTSAQYLELVERIRRELPDAVLRSTFLVGLPGETDEDFQELLDFQEAAQLDWMGAFVYSREEGTPAYALRHPGGERARAKDGKRRKAQLEDVQIPISWARLDRWVGRIMPVLIEERVAEETLYLGRGPHTAPEVDGLVVVHGEGLPPGHRVPVKILRRNGFDLEGVAAP
jgi:ribosomal protein S12 methylthiotransferase